MDDATVTVTMTHAQASALETAIVDLPDLVAELGKALTSLSDALGAGHMHGQDVAPMLSLFARALASVDHVEGKALREFDPLLRKGISDRTYLLQRRAARRLYSALRIDARARNG